MWALYLLAFLERIVYLFLTFGLLTFKPKRYFSRKIKTFIFYKLKIRYYENLFNIYVIYYHFIRVVIM